MPNLFNFPGSLDNFKESKLLHSAAGEGEILDREATEKQDHDLFWMHT